MVEMITDPITSSVMKLKYLELIRKRDKQCSEIDIFQNLVFHNGRAIREAINTGQRSFDDFLILLDKASKFKRFLSMQNPEKALLDAYYAEIKKESWVDKLPGKTVRLVVANGLATAAEALFPTGGMSNLLAAGYSAFDSFLLDKLLKGWHPNQFVEEELSPFVSGAK